MILSHFAKQNEIIDTLRYNPAVVRKNANIPLSYTPVTTVLKVQCPETHRSAHQKTFELYL